MTGSLVGCVDARKSFDEFADRTGVVDASTIDRPPSQIHDISGSWLVAFRAGFESSGSPALFVQFLVTWNLMETGNAATLNTSAVPLCVVSTCAERSTIPPPFVDNNRTVNADGTFVVPIVGTLPAMGNPFSGTNQPLDGQLVATILSADMVCGSVAGTAAGLDLVGSTFAAIRVTDTSPGALPAPIAACPDQQPVDAGVDAPVDAAPDA